MESAIIVEMQIQNYSKITFPPSRVVIVKRQGINTHEEASV